MHTVTTVTYPSSCYIRVIVLSFFIIFFGFYFVSYVYMVVCFVCFCLILQIICSYCYVMYFYYYVMCSRVSLSILIVIHVTFCVFWLTALFSLLFACNCVLHCCHWVSTQLPLNIYPILVTTVPPVNILLTYGKRFAEYWFQLIFTTIKYV
jgi:hypothetical protein